MESLDNLELRDQSVYPDEQVLQGALKRSFPSYLALLDLFEQHEMQHEWRYYNDGKAWLCKVQKKKRTIIWMSAWKGFLKATVYVPHKHLGGLYALPLVEETKERIRSTKDVGKSKPCTFEIRNQRILKELDKVMQFKIQNK
jgi:hypothetical protein